MSLPRVAVLDDYQEVARSSADWSPVTGRIDLTVFTDHISDDADLARRLAPFDVIVAMRERTPFPAGLLDQLPALKLLITTGMRNTRPSTWRPPGAAALRSAAPAGQPAELPSWPGD